MKKVLAVFVLLVAVVPLSPVWGQVEFPESLKGVVPEYPGATVALCMMAEEGARVHLDVDADPETSTDFYKKAMVEKGWTVEADIVYSGGSMVVLKKGGDSLRVTAESDTDGKTRLVLMLTSE